jgi:hypothetical protein
MQSNFTKLRGSLYSLQVDLPCDYSSLIQELQGQPWVADEAGYGQNNFETRYRLREPSGKLLNDIVKDVEHGGFKQELITALYSDSFFAGYWGLTPEKMDQTTHLYALYTWDRPGYNIRIHTDDRMHVAQGMIYFINGDDPDQSTYAYTDKEGNNALRVPTGYGCGFVNANLNDSWHTGKNSSTQERYSLMIGLRLKQFHT